LSSKLLARNQPTLSKVQSLSVMRNGFSRSSRFWISLAVTLMSNEGAFRDETWYTYQSGVGALVRVIRSKQPAIDSHRQRH
jgi:hypothetical protein